MSCKERIFDSLKQTADAIIGIFQRNLEVVIHDLSKPRDSIVYIVGDVTHRKVGGR